MLKANISSCPNKRLEGRELLNVKIYASPNKGMTGCDLRWARNKRGMSQQRLAQLMGEARIFIRRLEGFHKQKFYLHPTVIQQLVDVLGLNTLHC